MWRTDSLEKTLILRKTKGRRRRGRQRMRWLDGIQHLPGFAQVHVHCIADAIQHLILWHSLLLMPSVFPSIRGFSSESSVHIRWPKYWRFSFSISPSGEYSGLISLKIDWFDLLAVQQGTFRSLLQNHRSKASVLWHSAFFMVLLSHHMWQLWRP